jgi:hypothetical protein
MRMQWDEKRLLIINPRTGAPIGKKALSKHFKRELAVGGDALKELVINKYFEVLQAGESWAIRLGMRNRFGRIIEGSAPPAPEVLGVPVEEPAMQISFVLPDKKPESPPVVAARLHTPTPPANPVRRHLGTVEQGNRRAEMSHKSEEI